MNASLWGSAMSDWKLADGSILSDEQIGQEAKEYEEGTWEGKLVSIQAGRPPLCDEELVTVPVKFPASMVAQIDRKSKNRSDFIRRAVAACL